MDEWRSRFLADPSTVRALLDHGATVDAPDPLGHTPLTYAAGSDLIPTDVVKLPIERGAGVNSKSPHANSGETSAMAAVAAPKAKPAVSAQSAIQRSLPLLQRADAGFTSRAGCISCHNDSLAAMAVGLARERGFAVDERLSAQQVKVNASTLGHKRGTPHQSFAGTGQDTIGALIFGYNLMGLNAEHYRPDLNTDAVAMYIQGSPLSITCSPCSVPTAAATICPR